MKAFAGILAEGRGALGDVACSPSEADAARIAVSTLDSFFLKAGQPDEFRLRRDNIKARWQAYDDAVVFYDYCVAKQIGQDAQDLTDEIAKAANLAPPRPDPNLAPGTLSSLVDAAKVLIGVATVGAVVYAAARVYGVAKAPPALTNHPAPPGKRRALPHRRRHVRRLAR